MRRSLSIIRSRHSSTTAVFKVFASVSLLAFSSTTNRFGHSIAVNCQSLDSKNDNNNNNSDKYDNDNMEEEVTTAHSFTGRMCAGTRAEETRRSDALFQDPFAKVLAGYNGMNQPMGSWILVPRTRFGDDVLVQSYYNKNCRQLVLLGAGMDARAFRTFSHPDRPGTQATIRLPELNVFEIDQPTTFHVKEQIIDKYKKGFTLTTKSRTVVPIDFAKGESWTQKLLEQGFDPSVPTVWLLEGLLYYLADDVVEEMAKDIGRLSAEGSVVFHDSVSDAYRHAGVAPGGAPFISGNDDYGSLWEKAGFMATVKNFDTIVVDRRRQVLSVRNSGANVTPSVCQGQRIVLFVVAAKVKKNSK